MGTNRVIHDVSVRLRKLLWDAFPQGDSEIPHMMPSESIVLAPPTNLAGGSDRRLSLWLYQVVENAALKNQPMQRGNTDEEERFPPLPLTLLYLLTPTTGSIEQDQRILGIAMQTLYDNARLVIRSADATQTADEVSILLAQRTLEELTRIWDALREPYRLSVCYEVRLVRIESRRGSRPGRIAERELAEMVPA